MTEQKLQRTTFQVMEDEDCAAVSDHANQFCTADGEGNLSGLVSSCRGSEGSPLYTLKFGRPVVLGILVQAPSTCNNATDQPTGIFARVAAYRRWISRITEQ
jgi:secreted trypsin-like serine protease